MVVSVVRRSCSDCRRPRSKAGARISCNWAGSGGSLKNGISRWPSTFQVSLTPRGRPRRQSPASANGSTILRINASAPSRAAVGRDRVACRALHAAMDRDHVLDVAVAPVKSVPFPITPRVASSGARRAVDYVAERAVLHARALREGISRYEGSRVVSRDLKRTGDPSERNRFARVGRLYLSAAPYRLVY